MKEGKLSSDEMKRDRTRFGEMVRYLGKQTRFGEMKRNGEKSDEMKRVWNEIWRNKGRK